MCSAKRAVNPFNQPRDAVTAIVTMWREYCEFISTQPRQECFRPDAISERCGDAFQQFVSDIVTERVVDGLELIEVEETHSQAYAGAAVELLAEAVKEKEAIRQLGDHVVLCEPG